MAEQLYWIILDCNMYMCINGQREKGFAGLNPLYQISWQPGWLRYLALITVPSPSPSLGPDTTGVNTYF